MLLFLVILPVGAAIAPINCLQVQTRYPSIYWPLKPSYIPNKKQLVFLRLHHMNPILTRLSLCLVHGSDKCYSLTGDLEYNMLNTTVQIFPFIGTLVILN